jgi:RNA polymerase primary sigma factor
MEPLRAYLKEIKNIPLLTAQEEIELAKRAKKGDKEARDKIIRSNLRLVINIAKKYAHLGSMPLMDLIAEGNIGLMHAVDKFDPRKGFRFSTYAAWWIKQNITRAIAQQQKTVRLPVYMNELLTKWKKAQEELTHKLKRPPTPQEIGKKLGLSKEKIEEVTNWLSATTLSLETPVGEEDEGELKDVLEDEKVVSPDSGFSRLIDKQRIATLLEMMSPREKKILDMRFGITDGKIHTLAQIAKKFGISRERVRQIEEQALKKLRNFIREQELNKLR